VTGCVSKLQAIAQEVINPRDIDVTLNDIGGLEDAKATLVRPLWFPGTELLIIARSLSQGP
jgi:hypothetical protein